MLTYNSLFTRRRDEDTAEGESTAAPAPVTKPTKTSAKQVTAEAQQARELADLKAKMAAYDREKDEDKSKFEALLQEFTTVKSKVMPAPQTPAKKGLLESLLDMDSWFK